ncbi:HAD family phosphatase [uncultured Tenacibaculum sp.]|uniref:HAD family hydrolase n=1 Tax=uncultured Tenacibaculum sp. TaxID=174713 RepID=UPI0026266C5F|nr:HAD family phosphatase [uncultured Tenacibaculum sp.]
MVQDLKCVIFDMDGVIIDSEELHKKAYYQVFESLGLDVSETLYTSFTGSSTLNAFQKLVKHFNLNDDPETLVLNKRKRYIDFFETDPNLKLIDGVEELIKYFFNKGYVLVLASSSAMVNINRVFDRFDLQQYFKVKISGAELKASKPHPEIFQKAVHLGGFNKGECIVIEDSDNGIQAANDAGIFVVGYDNPIVTNQTLKNADMVISDYKQLIELF